MASLVQDGSVALRVRFDGGEPPAPQELYFRGPVLTAFNGREWFALSQPEARAVAGWAAPTAANLQVQGAPLGYELTLEPHQQTWLLTLDAAQAPPELPHGGRALMSPELQWSATRPIHSVLRYRAESHLRFTHGPQRRTPQMQPYVQLPPELNPRTLALARQMQANPRLAAGGAQAFVDDALRRLRSGGYRYTLEPGLYGAHAADEFWFDRKEGFCEHIASAFVVLMRALDVPARIVTGYQGGQQNPIDGYWTVHQSDAHAWAEVWIAGRGWVRVDPTGAVAPGRVGQLQRLQAPRGMLGTAMDAVVSPTLVQHLRTVWEAANNGWNQWVLNYTQARQFDLLKTLGFAAPSWLDLVRLLGLLICAGRPARRPVGAVGAQPPGPLATAAAEGARTPGTRRPGTARPPAAARHGQRRRASGWAHPPRPPRNGCCAWSKHATPPNPAPPWGSCGASSPACRGPRHNRAAQERHDILDRSKLHF